MTVINKQTEDQYLYGIAKYISAVHTSHPDAKYLFNNPRILDEYVQSIKIDWHQIAEELQTNRNRIYHWYCETHLRKMYDSLIGKDEKQNMTYCIIQGIQNGTITDPKFQMRLKQQVFGDKFIHRAEFSIVYNNIVRTKQIKDLLAQHNIMLPGKRSALNSNVMSRALSPSKYLDPVPISQQQQIKSPQSNIQQRGTSFSNPIAKSQELQRQHSLDVATSNQKVESQKLISSQLYCSTNSQSVQPQKQSQSQNYSDLTYQGSPIKQEYQQNYSMLNFNFANYGNQQQTPISNDFSFPKLPNNIPEIPIYQQISIPTVNNFNSPDAMHQSEVETRELSQSFDFEDLNNQAPIFSFEQLNEQLQPFVKKQ